MKLIHIISKTIFCLSLVILIACKDDNKANATNIFEIASETLNKELDKSATSFSIPVTTTLSVKEWEVVYTDKWLTAFPSADHINVSIQENTGDKRTATINVISPIRKYTITITQYGSNDVVVDADIQIKPYGGKASEYQPGYGIEKSYDGKFTIDGTESHYHSLWNNTQLPVTLEYYFRGDTEIDYFIYYTRSGNGNFGEGAD